MPPYLLGEGEFRTIMESPAPSGQGQTVLGEMCAGPVGVWADIPNVRRRSVLRLRSLFALVGGGSEYVGLSLNPSPSSKYQTQSSKGTRGFDLVWCFSAGLLFIKRIVPGTCFKHFPIPLATSIPCQARTSQRGARSDTDRWLT